MPSRHALGEKLEIRYGPGLWADVRWPQGRGLFRFELVDDDGLRIAEMRLLNPARETLDSVPLDWIESTVRTDIGGWEDLARGRHHEPPANLWAFFGERARLERPSGRELAEDFYVQVARAYNAAVHGGLSPRETLAWDAHVSADSVARWVVEARQRGYLPPTTRGKVTSGETQKLRKASRA